MRRRTLLAAALAGSLLSTVPAIVLAHPLGNFTINHYAGLTVTPDAVELDVVIDMAEIPTFQERLRIDANEDGRVSGAESAAAAPTACLDLAADLSLTIDDRASGLVSRGAAIVFPSGLGGLLTMRLECSYEAAYASNSGAARSATIEFEDRSYAERIGWREIVAVGRAMRIDAGDIPATSLSGRLTAYPEERLDRPLDVRSATIVATPEPAAGGGGGTAPASDPGGGSPSANSPATAAAVPGGLGADDLPAIFRSGEFSPFVLLVSLVTALALGAIHALTPGHGKTLMAAYLVGARGRPVHAVGLGLAVSVSHTVGILVLAAVVVAGHGLLPAETVSRVAPIVAAVGIVAVGAWMLVAEIRRRRDCRHEDHGPRDHPHHDRDHAQDAHSHGGHPHAHLPPAASSLGWRSLGALGLAGGLIPSTSALFILLVSVDVGRPAFGFVLVAAFGLGMAVVMSGVGLAVLFARDRAAGLAGRPAFGRAADLVPLAAAVVVLAFGVYLTAQAVAVPPSL
ncbi:MAG TPA: hypothetical protein VFO50_02120 [Candidatus Limnocylindrales bacterium]|nr:hypothetical protein [Candidatus Limnocylindrales bacterium]